MTQPRGRLYVNPDGVVSVGDSYDEHVQIYDTYLNDLVSLRERYAQAWGDDDMGQQFSTKFLAGLDNLESLIGGVRGTLKYTSEGLQSFGKAYAEADESARDVGLRMRADFEESFTPRSRAAYVERSEGVLPDAAMEPLAPTRRVVREAVRAPLARMEGTIEGSEVRPARQRAQLAVTPAHGLVRGEVTAALPAMPSISSMMIKPEYADARIGGEPLPAGYRLQALNPYPDGTTRVDANLYESITPLSGATATTADGRPIDPQGRQLFVVKDNPTVDATRPGYQPLVLSYAPDGTPSPLIPGDA